MRYSATEALTWLILIVSCVGVLLAVGGILTSAIMGIGR